MFILFSSFVLRKNKHLGTTKLRNPQWTLRDTAEENKIFRRESSRERDESSIGRASLISPPSTKVTFPSLPSSNPCFPSIAATCRPTCVRLPPSARNKIHSDGHPDHRCPQALPLLPLFSCSHLPIKSALLGPCVLGCVASGQRGGFQVYTHRRFLLSFSFLFAVFPKVQWVLAKRLGEVFRSH